MSGQWAPKEGDLREVWAACDEWRTMAPADQPEPTSPYEEE